MNHAHHDAPRNAAGYVDLTTAEVNALLGKVRLIDVRQTDEYRGDLGHIAGAELVPLGVLGGVSASWPRDEALVMICRSGARSAQAASALARMGFTRVHNMVGGMMRWNADRRPIER